MRLLTLILFLAVAGCSGDERTGIPPVPDFTHSCVEFLCTFDASATSNADGGVYQWNFGDDSQGGGVITTHAYSESDEMTVVLTVINRSGNAASMSKRIEVTGNPAAEYFNAIHDNFAVLLLLEDVMMSVIPTLDAIQDEVEVRGNPADIGYTFNCPEGGTAEIIEWVDANNSLTIDGTEALVFEVDGCRFGDADSALTSAGTAQIAGDFDSSSFSIGQSGSEIGRLRIAGYSRWAIQGLIDVTATRAGDTIESIAYVSTDLRTLHVTESGRVDLTVQTPVDLVSDFGSTTGIGGEWTVRFSGQIPTTYSAEVQQPLHFGVVNGETRMQAGQVGMYVRSDRVDVSVAPDPARLSLDVDTGDDAVVDYSAQFPQSISVERL